MKKLTMERDYRKLRPNNISSPEYSHLLLLLYWVFYGIVFPILERGLILDYNVVYSRLDDYIPFCEFFLIPYYFWFLLIIGMLLYSVLYNIKTFENFMRYIILTNTITLLIYILYPTAQELRPTEFARDNIFIDIIKWMYDFDTNTNVCPSLHVLNTLAICFSAWQDDNFKTRAWRIFFIVSGVLIIASTVFLKQHSVIDIFWGVVLGVLCYPVIFPKKKEKTEIQNKELVTK